MGEKHIARLEPVGIEMEVDEDETILDAAFRQGIMLMHGCKEGQCSSCKSFLLDGEVDLDRYSTFALPDFEEAEGYTLLCRAHALSDVEIELLHYDEERIRSGVPIVTATTEVEAVEELTHDIRRLVLRVTRSATALEFKAGQYVDIGIPGAEGEHRSFSMANAPGEPDRLEFMIKLYEGGRFSGLLANGDGIAVGDELTLQGPVRDVHAARQLAAAAGVHRRRRGDGAGPVAAALDGREGHASAPATFYYGARTPGRPVRARGDRAPRRRAARLQLRPRALRGRGGRRPGRARPGSSPTSSTASRTTTSPTSTPTSAARRRWSTPRSRCSSAAACPESHIYFDRFTTSAA